VIPVHLAVFLLMLPMIFVGGMALGYSQGFALAIRRQSSRNYRVRAEGDDHLRAEEKAAALLRSWLSPEQAELWDSHRHFYVVGSDTGRRYRIKYGQSMNIEELDSGGHVVNQCRGSSGRDVRDALAVHAPSPSVKSMEQLILVALAARRSELVALDLADIKEYPEGLRVTIRRSKTDQEGAGAVVAVCRGSIACPVAAVRDWQLSLSHHPGRVISQGRQGRSGVARPAQKRRALPLSRRPMQRAWGSMPTRFRGTACGRASSPPRRRAGPRSSR
jgi:hypothetical protein